MNEQPPAASAPYGTTFLPPGERRHEASDVNVFWVLVFAAGLAIGAVLTHAVLWLFFQGLALTEPHKERRPPPPADARALAPPEPRLQTDYVADLKALRTDEDARLSRYQWANKSAGIVRIPVSRAMELVAQRGLPEWKAKTSDELTRDAFGNLRAGGKDIESGGAHEH